MGRFTSLPVLEATFLAPKRTSVDVLGNAIDGGQNGLGESIEIEIAPGGRLVSSYEDCKIRDEQQFEYINWLGAYLNGGFRCINVPIITDWWGPFPAKGAVKQPFITGIPHSDGSMFTDGAGYSQASVYGEIRADASSGAGQLTMQVYGAARPLRWSDWFSIYHPNKGWRAYRYWKVISKTSTPSPTYTLAIGPALREAITAGTRVEFARPLFAAKFKRGFTLPSISEAFYSIEQTIQFSEAS